MRNERPFLDKPTHWRTARGSVFFVEIAGGGTIHFFYFLKNVVIGDDLRARSVGGR